MTVSFGARLRQALDARGPLCVGIDPHSSLLLSWGLSDDVAGLGRFAGTVVEALAGQVAVLKPQSAFFERFGSRGIAVLERTIADARAAGALVLLDAKRGDIGSTVEAYAQAYLDPSSPLFADALTASPYLGFESLEPLYATALRHGGGVFVLGFTSNPEGAGVQRARTAQGTFVGSDILERVAARNAKELAAAGHLSGASSAGPDDGSWDDRTAPLGSLGVVLGATLPDLPFDLGRLAGPVLAPGFGAQGGSAADLARIFGPVRHAVIPSTSREVLGRGPRIEDLRSAATSAVADFRLALSDLPAESLRKVSHENHALHRDSSG